MRVDTHVYAGYTVPPYYDSLLAKLIVHGRDRAEALARIGQALDSFIIEGVTTTIPFLARVIRHPDFVAGNIDTKFLEREPQLLRPESPRSDVALQGCRPGPPPMTADDRRRFGAVLALILGVFLALALLPSMSPARWAAPWAPPSGVPSASARSARPCSVSSSRSLDSIASPGST